MRADVMEVLVDSLGDVEASLSGLEGKAAEDKRDQLERHKKAIKENKMIAELSFVHPETKAVEVLLLRSWELRSDSKHGPQIEAHTVFDENSIGYTKLFMTRPYLGEVKFKTALTGGQVFTCQFDNALIYEFKIDGSCSEIFDEMYGGPWVSIHLTGSYTACSID